jgi:protein tyrosine phosphatase (PTP) superfamily phosphohydrolase (DUF442 family)
MRSTASVLFVAWFSVAACGLDMASNEATFHPPSVPSARDSAKIVAKGLNNVYRITPQLYSGSSPEGEEGFRSLRTLGIKTIISVDGAKPDIDRAKKLGLRYVHLPVGYDGISQEQSLRLAKAMRELPGPVYIHCHHGKHRGPAAAIAHLCLDESCGLDTVVAEMRRAGTDPHYTGLFASAKAFRRPSPQELEALPTEFPEVAKVAALAEMMVAVDERWENLKKVRAVGWKPPPDSPDLDPAHEALQLVEHYREASRLRQVRDRADEFRRWLAEAEKRASQLEGLLRAGREQNDLDRAATEKVFRKVGDSCAQCHGKYRDAPKP